jgi:hypothetical protein
VAVCVCLRSQQCIRMYDKYAIVCVCRCVCGHVCVYVCVVLLLRVCFPHLLESSSVFSCATLDAGQHNAVDGFQYVNSMTEHYFLTHYHSDHYGGLRKTFHEGTICRCAWLGNSALVVFCGGGASM